MLLCIVVTSTQDVCTISQNGFTMPRNTVLRCSAKWLFDVCNMCYDVPQHVFRIFRKMCVYNTCGLNLQGKHMDNTYELAIVVRLF